MLTKQFNAAIAGARTSTMLDDLMRHLVITNAAGHIGDAEAGPIEEAIQARRAALARPPAGTSIVSALPASVRRKLARPRSPNRIVSIERRRRQATSGTVPPQIAASFTLGEIAALSVIAHEARKCGSCTLFVAAIAAKAGVGHTTVQNAVRLAERLELIRRQERRQSRARNWANVLTIISPEWKAWLRLRTRKAPSAFKKPGTTDNRFISYGYERQKTRFNTNGHDQVEPDLGTFERMDDPQRYIRADSALTP